MATASKVATIDAKTIYATDLSEARPIAAEHRKRVQKNGRTIRVGHIEQTPHGTLRCVREGEAIVIKLEKNGALVGRALILPFPRNEKAGALRESDFSVQVSEFIGTPWHALDYLSFWTVQGLRTKGTMEASLEL
jgi:hypothetical protein